MRTMDTIMAEITTMTDAGNKEEVNNLLSELVTLGASIRKEREAKKMLEPMKESRFNNEGRAITCPNDTITVMHFGGLSNTISLHITNPSPETIRYENEYKSIKNCLDGWEYLKELNEIGSRKVVIELTDKSIIPYEDSAPYKYRFTK